MRPLDLIRGMAGVSKSCKRRLPRSCSSDMGDPDESIALIRDRLSLGILPARPSILIKETVHKCCEGNDWIIVGLIVKKIR